MKRSSSGSLSFHGPGSSTIRSFSASSLGNVRSFSAGSLSSIRSFSAVPAAWAEHVDACPLVPAGFDWEGSLSLELGVLDAAEQALLAKEVDKPLRRRRYQGDHWDGVIAQYREIGMPAPKWSPAARAIIEEKLMARLPRVDRPLLEPHVLDLSGDGAIYPHVDNVEFSGVFVAGLSLLSSAVMRLRPAGASEGTADGGAAQPTVHLLLPPGSLYVMKNEFRYRWEHEILGSKDSMFRGEAVARDRRISLLLRDGPLEDKDAEERERWLRQNNP